MVLLKLLKKCPVISHWPILLMFEIALFVIPSEVETLHSSDHFVIGPEAFFRNKLSSFLKVGDAITRRTHRRSDNDNEDVTEPIRQGRLFSNPFGILGHDHCNATIEDKQITGICYNEVECVVRGGTVSGYCGPPAVKGGCCVFATSDCDKRIREKTFYFRNKSFPRNDLEPFQCLLKIKPLKDVCWIRLDYLDFELSSDGSGGTCVYESFGIMNSPDGPGGRLCGYKSGYSTITRAPQGKDLGLSVVVQGPSYRWNVKISQIRCDQVVQFPSYEGCGIRNGDENNTFQRISTFDGNENFLREKKSTPSSPFLVVETTPPTMTADASTAKTRRLVKKKVFQKLEDSEISDSLSMEENCQENQDHCDLFGILNATNVEEAQEGFRALRRRQKSRRSASGRLELENESIVSKKRFRGESYHPSFSARTSFCTPKIREKISPDCSRTAAQRFDENMMQKIIDGSETGINEYPWMVSLQLGQQHFCGGSLVSDLWILTAAHCMDFGSVKDFLPRVIVSLADHDISITTETKNFHRKVVQVINYPTWHNLATVKGDLVLVKLDRPVEYSRNASPVCLPKDASETYARQTGVSIGWGITEDGKPSKYLREVQLNIIENSTCYEQYSLMDIQIHDDMMCTLSGPKGTETICSGDSGSPLMIAQNGRLVQIGLTSYGLTDCSSMFPSVFSRITFYLEWMRAAITPVP